METWLRERFRRHRGDVNPPGLAAEQDIIVSLPLPPVRRKSVEETELELPAWYASPVPLGTPVPCLRTKVKCGKCGAAGDAEKLRFD